MAAVPGIDLEKSDVYQTSDLPESDQHYFQSEETNDSIDTIHISANEAFGKFKRSFLNTNNVDFSDKLRRSKQKGYISWKGVPENTKEETPVKKYQRLNCEVRELLDEISAARKGNSSGMEKETLESLSSQVEVLYKYLLEMRLEVVLGKETVAVMTDPQAATRQKLVSQLQEINSIRVEESNTKDNTNMPKGGSNDGMVYSILLKPESAKLREGAELANLHSRIAILEKCVGLSEEQLSILGAETGRRTLLEAVSVLTSKTAVLEPKNLDHIEGRLAVLQQKLNKFSEAPGGENIEEDPEVARKLDDLYKYTERSSSAANEVPDVIDRLEVLSPLHTQASELSAGLLELETVQQQMVTQLGNNSRLLKEVQKQFQSNLQSIGQNFDSLNSRIEKLKK